MPPCVVFIDEVHALPRNLIPELLKAVEPKDGILVVENGTEADCRKVCWIIATTERGLLFPPFENRFRKIHLEMYGAEEIAAIVQLDHPLGICPCANLPSSIAVVFPARRLPSPPICRRNGRKVAAGTGPLLRHGWRKVMGSTVLE